MKKLYEASDENLYGLIDKYILTSGKADTDNIINFILENVKDIDRTFATAIVVGYISERKRK